MELNGVEIVDTYAEAFGTASQQPVTSLRAGFGSEVVAGISSRLGFAPAGEMNLSRHSCALSGYFFGSLVIRVTSVA